MAEIQNSSSSSHDLASETTPEEGLFLQTKTRRKRNQMSFTMKRINMEKLETQSSVKDEAVSSFACRADVIYKKILRDFRRYFTNEFSKITGVKDPRKCKSKQELGEHLLKVTQQLFGEEIDSTEEVAFAVGSLICPQQMNCNILGRKRSKKEAMCVHDALYKFSITKLDSLMDKKYIGYLLKLFVSDEENKRILIESSQISAESYATAFEMLQTRSEKAISSC